jgi:hypothetical protein
VRQQRKLDPLVDAESLHESLHVPFDGTGAEAHRLGHLLRVQAAADVGQDLVFARGQRLGERAAAVGL